MPATVTPNYELTKPEVTGSPDVWGNFLNTDLDILDTALKGVDVSAKGSLQKAGLVADRTALDLLLYADTVADPSLTSTPLALMTNNAVRALLNALMPVGTIIMWGGSIATIPAGWGLCDGTVQNGVTTPNMIGRFPFGGGAPATGVVPGTSGGSSTLAYSGAVGGHVLSYNEMPAHNHSVYDPTHFHYYSDPGHVHGTTAGSSSTQGFGDTGGRQAAYASNNTSTGYTNISISYAPTNISLYNAGSNWAHDHPVAFAIPWQNWYPPFYAVCYIMRVKAF